MYKKEELTEPLFKEESFNPDALLKKYNSDSSILNVNGHIHTPYSFCSFDSIKQIFQLASEENIALLGINDFFTTKGYEEFLIYSNEYRIFPLFNIEFMGLIKEYQDKGIQINDPNNPGRIYFSGKGLDYPFHLPKENYQLLQSIVSASQDQMKEMVKKAGEHLNALDSSMELHYDILKNSYAKDILRERHIAKAMREAVMHNYKDIHSQTNFYTQLFDGDTPKSDPADPKAIENEIRSRLLKSGGKAFVQESGDAFPDLKDIINLINEAGGIPCYPVLLDFGNSQYTHFESDWKAMHAYLSDLNVRCIELIPARNTVEALEDFVHFFSERNYIITFGTEHNTPGIFPLEVTVQKNKKLSEKMKKISYQGCCIIAAHQFLRAHGNPGFMVDSESNGMDTWNYYIELGNAVIKDYRLGN